MNVKVKSTGKILDVYAYERGEKFQILTYIDYRTNTIYKSEDLDLLSNEEVENLLTGQKAEADYQERSTTAGDCANQLAWAFIILLCAMLIGGSKYAEPYVMAAGGICYMLLSALQALWQAVTFWIIKNRIKRDGLLIDDYPQWVGGGAWVFYYLKMAVITATATYAFWHFIVLI
jgi:hypothetical protein